MGAVVACWARIAVLGSYAHRDTAIGSRWARDGSSGTCWTIITSRAYVISRSYRQRSERAVVAGCAIVSRPGHISVSHSSIRTPFTWRTLQRETRASGGVLSDLRLASVSGWSWQETLGLAIVTGRAITCWSDQTHSSTILSSRARNARSCCSRIRHKTAQGT